MLLVSVQDRCVICAKHTIGPVEAHFILFGDSANLNASQAHKLFWTHPMELLGDVDHVESCFGPFEDGISISAR
jgi:hypothetical protein